MSRPVAPPTGFPPPGSATLGGDRIAPELQAAIKLERLEHLHTYEVVAT